MPQVEDMKLDDMGVDQDSSTCYIAWEQSIHWSKDFQIGLSRKMLMAYDQHLCGLTSCDSSLVYANTPKIITKLKSRFSAPSMR